MTAQMTRAEWAYRYELAELNRRFLSLHAARDTMAIHETLTRIHGLTEQEIRLFYVFLRAYLTPRTPITIKQFTSKVPLLSLLSKEIAKVQKEHQLKKWLSRNYPTLKSILDNCEKKGIILRLPHEHERILYPELFPENTARIISTRKTWKIHTLQPGRTEQNKNEPGAGFPLILDIDDLNRPKRIAARNASKGQQIKSFDWLKEHLESYLFGKSNKQDTIDYYDPHNSLEALREYTFRNIDSARFVKGVIVGMFSADELRQIADHMTTWETGEGKKPITVYTDNEQREIAKKSNAEIHNMPPEEQFNMALHNPEKFPETVLFNIPDQEHSEVYLSFFSGVSPKGSPLEKYERAHNASQPYHMPIKQHTEELTHERESRKQRRHSSQK